MRKLLTVIACALLSLPALTQTSLADSLADYEGRFTKLNKAYAKDPNNVENLFNMAQFYFDNSHPMRNLPMAMTYITAAEARQTTLLEEDRIGELTRLARKDITLGSIRQMKQAITDAAFNTLEVRTDMSRAELDSYMSAFSLNMDMVRVLRQSRINQVYEEDLRKGTLDAYYHFIDNYPGTKEAEQMEERIAHLAPGMFEGATTEAEVDAMAVDYPLSPSVQRAAERQKSRLAFAIATRRNTEEAYKEFLRHYPTSDENQAARDRLEQMLTSKYAALHTAREYADFAQANSDVSLADSALARMRQLMVEQHDVEAARLYLEHFKSDTYYKEVFNRFYSWHTIEGNSAPINKFVADYPDYPFQNAVDRDLMHAEEVDRVNLMVDFLEVQFGLYAGYIRQMMDKRIAIVPLQRSLQVLVAQRNWNKALERAKQFDICFDKEARANYLELCKVLSTPTGRQLKSELNATYHILNPVINPADGNLYFTRGGGSSRRICYAVRESGHWRTKGDVPFDNTTNEGLTIYSFFADGTRMLLGHGGDIWIAEKDGDKWRVSDIPSYPVNTDYREADAYMLPDGTGMLLASDRPGGQNLQPSGAYFHGDTAMASDIYFIPFNEQGWGTPVNLGTDINTPYCERSPILSRNLKTLYFVSDGRGGLGYRDIYMSTRDNVEDWSHWSTPVNVGRELNSGYDEYSISFGPDEKTIVVSANSAMGRYSASSFNTWHDASNSYRPYQLDILGMEDHLLRVRVADIAQQSVIQAVDYMGEGRSVNLNIHKDKRYAVLAEAGDYFVPAVVVSGRSKNDLRLKGYKFEVAVALDKPLTLEAIEFDPGSADLRPVTQMQLQQLAHFLQQNPDGVAELGIDVAGSSNEQAYNLSLERGRALRDYLVELDIDPQHVIVSAYGNVNVKKRGSDRVTVRFRQQ